MRPRARAALAGSALLLLLATGLDFARPPRDQVAARALLGGIRLYRLIAARPLAALGVRCRFTPTCSHYAETVIARDGALVGAARAAWRLLRCGPWTPAGTADPP